ncbi:hypothetical protein [Actinoplanes sp. NPDC051851]|uniref:hypothetical protein n=1 Tax=Actinoplanes sp. NPDC051851 TaxID=3154753 RepID=UPI00343F0AB7
MTDDEQHGPVPEGRLYASATAITATSERRNRRRKQALVAVTGAAAVLAGAGFLVTQLMNAEQPTLPEPAALAPLTRDTTAPAVPARARESGVREVAPTSRGTRRAVPAKRSPIPAPSESLDPLQALASAAAGAEADLPRGKIAQAPGAEVASGPVYQRIVHSGSTTVRLSSARYDLTGHADMMLADDAGEDVGSGVTCTRRLRPGTGGPGLLCWRTSANRSVVALATDPARDPDLTENIRVVVREWSRLN